MRAARIHVITLGLIEVWRNPDTQKSYIIKPYKEIHAPSEFHLSSFEDNYRNLREVVEIIRSFGDDRQVLLSVSPVPLSSTFTKDDVVVANMRSKSTLRTVAAEIDKLYSNVHYVPSYEFVSKHNSYERDGIHVRRDAVEAIVDMTLDSYMKTN